MEIYDLIVVGAGPAGSTAAYYADGLKTLIIDKSDFPRHKACGGGLMSSRDWPLEFENFKNILEKLEYYPLTGLKMYWNKTFVASCRFKHLFDEISRFELDHLLLRAALEKKNVSFLKFMLKEIRRGQIRGERVYELSDGVRKIYAKKIIGADGINSLVGRYLGNKNLKRRQYGLCLEYELVCPKKETDKIHVSPGFGWEIGYAWLFPTREGYQVGVGMVRRTRKDLKKYLDDYLNWTVENGLVPKEYTLKNTFGGAVPLKLAAKYCTDDIMLCGDAMGLVKQLTGEGIYYAMKSGKIAGQVVSKSRENMKVGYEKMIRMLVWDTFLTPYIPPKIFTLAFWAGFFYLGKFLFFISDWNLPMGFFIRLAIHRLGGREDSYYRDEKILINE